MYASIKLNLNDFGKAGLMFVVPANSITDSLGYHFHLKEIKKKRTQEFSVFECESWLVMIWFISFTRGNVYNLNTHPSDLGWRLSLSTAIYVYTPTGYTNGACNFQYFYKVAFSTFFVLYTHSDSVHYFGSVHIGQLRMRKRLCNLLIFK